MEDGKFISSVGDFGIYRMPTGKYNIYRISTGKYFTGNYTSLERAYETAKEKAAVITMIESPIEKISLDVPKPVQQAQTVVKIGDPFHVSAYQRRMFEV